MVGPRFNKSTNISPHLKVAAASANKPAVRRRRITFNELVECVEDSTTTPLKFSPENPTAPPIGILGGNSNLNGGDAGLLGMDPTSAAKWNFPSSTVRNPNPGRLFDSASAGSAKVRRNERTYS